MRFNYNKFIIRARDSEIYLDIFRHFTSFNINWNNLRTIAVTKNNSMIKSSAVGRAFGPAISYLHRVPLRILH